MPCHNFEKGGFICTVNTYKYKHNNVDYIFEWHDYLGPMLLDEDYEEAGMPEEGHPFYEVCDIFQRMTKEERKEFLIYD